MYETISRVVVAFAAIARVALDSAQKGKIKVEKKTEIWLQRKNLFASQKKTKIKRVEYTNRGKNYITNFFKLMEVFDLHAPAQLICAELPQIPAYLEEKCNQLNANAGNLSPAAIRYAEQWMRQGDVYYDSQTYEYRALYNYLQFRERDTHVLFLATLPGTAIAVLPPKQEWMACDLSEPGSGPAGAGFTVLKEELRLARKPDGQSRIFQPQGSCAFGERYLFALLNIVGQDYTSVIIDATSSREYDFHMRIALNKITTPYGCFVWRVGNDFLVKPENQALISRLLQEFDSVTINTIIEHDRFDTHFIVASARREQPREPNPDLPTIIDRLVDYWIYRARCDYIQQMCMASYFHSINIRTTADTKQHWDAHSSEYYYTRQKATPVDKFIPKALVQ